MNKNIFKSGLYIVSLPIGNLNDITSRAKVTISNSDYILCEDTRNTLKILNYFKISKKLVSYHKFNESKIKDTIIEDLKKGKIISLVSDSGTPSVSDPGKGLITAVHKNNINIFPVPGVSAPIAAYSVSGFQENFHFAGFLPKKLTEAERYLIRLKKINGVLIFFIPSRDLKKYHKIIAKHFYAMEFFIAREITKIHETYIRDKVRRLERYVEKNNKGELTLLIDNNFSEQKEDNPVDIVSEIKLLIGKMKSKDISEYLGNKYNLSKKSIYQKVIKLLNE
tara:strand:- start:68344 stop:69183 length:840 start_codon:yes stop_codon:yes gene_type:complete